MISAVNLPSRRRVIVAFCGLLLCATLVMVYAVSITLSSWQSASSHGVVLVLVWILAVVALYFLGRSARYWSALWRQDDPEGQRE
jgi:uncharacterized membrane protein YcjF (UPF0283 family)